MQAKASGWLIALIVKFTNLCRTGTGLPLDPPALGSIPSVPKKFSEEKIVNVGDVNQQCCLEKSGQ